MTLVSVIVPTFNRAHTLPAALESVRAQTCQSFEVIVVDDHSEDRGATKEVVESMGDPRFRYVYLDKNGGPAAARNAALPFCRGEYLSFLDSDDCFRPEKLEKHLDIFSKYPEVAMVYSDEYLMTADGRISDSSVWQNRVPSLPSGHIALDFFKQSFIGTMTVTVKKSVFHEVGGFDAALIYNEDDDLWLRIMLRYPVVCSDYVSGLRRLHESNMSRNGSKMIYFQLKCIVKYIAEYPDFIASNSPEVMRRVRRLVVDYVKCQLRNWKLPAWPVIKEWVRVRREVGLLAARRPDSGKTR